MASLPTAEWTLDHIGHAVIDLAAAVELYQNTFGFRVELRETLASHLVEVAFLQSGGTLIELLQPQPENQQLNKFIRVRGPGLHHICFRVPSVTAELKRLAALGVKLIDSEARPGSRGMHIAFLHPKAASGVLIELASYGT